MLAPSPLARREGRQSRRASTKHNALVDFRTRKNTTPATSTTGVYHSHSQRGGTHKSYQSSSLALPPRHRVGPEAASVIGAWILRWPLPRLNIPCSCESPRSTR
eukprot:scaffold32406_cov70-Phaeocystis_antarctica.AAC.3